MKIRHWFCLAAVAMVAACRAPELAADTPRTSDGSPPRPEELVSLGVTATISSESAQSAYKIQYAQSEVSKVAVGIFERSTSIQPLLGYFWNAALTVSTTFPLTASESASFQSALGTTVGVGTASKTDSRRYLMRTFTAPLPASMATSFWNFPIATDSAPVHSYNIFVAAFDASGSILGYKESDLTWAQLKVASPSVSMTADLNYGGLGQINMSRTMYYGFMNPTGSVDIISGVFDTDPNPHLGFDQNGAAFDVSTKGYKDALFNYLAAEGLGNTTDIKRYFIKEYASPSAPAGLGTNAFKNVPAGTNRYRTFMMAFRRNYEDIGHYLSNPLSVSSGATTSLTMGQADLNGTVRVETGRLDTLASGIGVPKGIAVDSQGNVYTNASTSNITKRNASGTQLALFGNGTMGWTDTASGTPQFRDVRGLALDASDNLYVGECGNHDIRKIAAADGTVTTVAGHGPSASGFSDTASGDVKFNCPRGLAVDGQGVIYVADSGNHAIRKIATDGTVTTVAGNGTAGYQEGTGTAALFNGPRDVELSLDGSLLYVADSLNRRVRKITLATGATGLVAGTGNCCLDVGDSGPDTNLNTPNGLALDASGNIYLAESGNTGIRRISDLLLYPVRRMSTVQGGGCCVDSDGPPLASISSDAEGIASYTGGTYLILYLAQTSGNKIRRLR